MTVRTARASAQSHAWLDNVGEASWRSSADVRKFCAIAGIVDAERVGTHNAYDKVDVTEVRHSK
jgi:hypothetical protein